MIRQLYDWTISLAQTRHALWALAAVSFAESSVFPIPPDLLMIPMILAAPHRAFMIAGVCLTASVLGGLFGYLVGYGLFELLGTPILDFYGLGAQYEEIREYYRKWGVLTVLVAGLTPFPYKVITIFSGAVALNLPIFIITSIVARGLRFFAVAILIWKFGAPIREFVERRLGLMFTLFVVFLLGGLYMVRHL